MNQKFSGFANKQAGLDEWSYEHHFMINEMEVWYDIINK